MWCSKFQFNSWENGDTIFICISVLHWGDWKNKNWKKKAKINLSILIFIPTINLATLKVYTKFEDSASHRIRQICDRTFDWRERKMDKLREYYERGSLFSFTQYNNHTQHLFQISKSFLRNLWGKFPYVRNGRKEKKWKRMQKPESHGPQRSPECIAMMAIFSQNTVNVACKKN